MGKRHVSSVLFQNWDQGRHANSNDSSLTRLVHGAVMPKGHAHSTFHGNPQFVLCSCWLIVRCSHGMQCGGVSCETVSTARRVLLKKMVCSLLFAFSAVFPAYIIVTARRHGHHRVACTLRLFAYNAKTW